MLVLWRGALAAAFFDPVLGRFLDGVGFIYVGMASSSSEVSDSSVISAKSKEEPCIIEQE